MEFLTKVKRVLATHQIADHIEDFTNLTRVDDHLQGKCPICKESKAASMMVYPELRFYYCNECDSSGDVIDFVAKMQGLDMVNTVNLLYRFLSEERAGDKRGTRHDVTLAERERRDRAWGLLVEEQPEFINRPVWRLEEWEL